MTTVLSLTYDDTHARVLISATSLPPIATQCLVESSTDNIHWTQVRGGAAVPVTNNSASIYDYEFTPNVINYYRVSAVSLTAPSFVASSTAVTAVNAPVTPTLPTGWAEGDLCVIWSAIRNSGAGSIVVPAGWTTMLQTDNICLMGRRMTATESAPTVTVTGGVTGADVIAHMSAFRNTERTPTALTWQKNPTGQNITYPGMAAVNNTWGMTLYLGWKQSVWTSPNGVTTITSATEIGEPISSAGSGAGLVWDYQQQPTNPPGTPPLPIPQGAFTVTGGTTAISYGAVVELRAADFITRTTTSIIPTMSQVWVKVPAAPYLNRTITLIDWKQIERTSRVGYFPVVQQLTTIAATDTAIPRTVSISVWSASDAEYAAVDLVLSLGYIILLHIPNNIALKSMYAGVGTYDFQRPAHLSHRGTFTIPLTEVPQPDLSTVGNLVTWATLITNYHSWQDVLNANATWSVVLALTGTPADATVGL
jgi:hypothetical protein